MKKIFINTLLITIFSCLIFNVNAQFSWINYDLVAHFPLTENGNEITSKTDPLYMEKITFNDGAAYSNGIYNGSFENGCYIQTPSFSNMNLANFGISLEVKVDTVYNKELPIFLLGKFNRYLGLYFDMSDDGSIRPFLFKNYGEHKLKSDTLLYGDTWYTFNITHNNDTTRIYINNVMILEQIAPFEFYDQEEDVETKILMNNNAGDGLAFRGYWKNLKIFTDDISASNDYSIRNENVQLFPNPSSDILNVSSLDIVNSWTIYDQFGHEINSKNDVFSYQTAINISRLTSGLYTVNITLKNHTFSNSRFIKL